MGKMHAEGVTLIELLVAVMVFAVVLAAGIPAFNDFIRNNRMSAAANDVVTSLHLARSEADKRQESLTLCAADAAEQCLASGGLEQGWIVFVDVNDNGQRDGDDETVLLVQAPLPEQIGDRTTWADDTGRPTSPFFITFTPSGYLVESIDGAEPVANLQLCDDRGSRQASGAAASGRWIEISPTGRPRIFSEQDQVQGSENPLGGCPEPA